MATPAIDLSAGLVPAPSAPSGGIDLSAGLVPQQQAAPVQQPTQGGGLLSTMYDNFKSNITPVEDLGKGALEGVGDSIQTAVKLGNKVTGGRLADQASIDRMDQLIHPDNATQSVGKGIESVAEFMLGDEALKGLSMAEKLAKVAPAIQKLEKSPALLRIAEKSMEGAQAASRSRVASTAIRQGVVGGAQGLAHGDSAEGSAVQGGIAAAGGALGEGASVLYKALKPASRTIEGVTMPALSEGAKKAGVTIADAPKIAAAQQAGGQQVIENIAQRVTREALQKVNASRMPLEAITDPARLLEAPEDMKPYSFDILTGEKPGGGRSAYPAERQWIGSQQFKQVSDGPAELNAGEKPEGYGGNRTPRDELSPGTNQYTSGVREGSEFQGPSGGGAIKTSDPAIAQQHLSAMNEMLADAHDPELAAHRDALQEQLDLYHAAKNAGPKFSPIDVNKAASTVNSFKGASDQIQAGVQPVYRRLDELSSGAFKKLRAAQKDAEKRLGVGSLEAQAAAHDDFTKATEGIDKIFDAHKGDISRPDYDAARTAWETSKVLDRAHATVEGMTNRVPKDVAERIGGDVQRTITNPSTSRLGLLLQREPRLARVIGQDGVDNLFHTYGLLQDAKHAPEARNFLTQLGEAARKSGYHIGTGAAIGGIGARLTGGKWREGAEAGGAIGAGLSSVRMANVMGKQMMREMATNPRVGQMVDYAVRNGVNPKLSIPLITGMLTSGTQQMQEASQ